MITYQSATKVFGEPPDHITALKDVSFTVPEGKVVVLLGPSGCGKTTTLRLTNRLERLSSGQIIVDNQSIDAINPVKLRQSMGYVIQEIGLFPNKTIGQNIAVVPKILNWKKTRINERINELLRMVNLEPDEFRDRYPAELSGGQQQRIGVARGLAANPEILLMDEPFGAIDPINRARIQDEFMELQNKLRKTVVFVSHDIHEAIKVGDMIGLFQEGSLIQYATPEVLLTRPANQFAADFVGADRTLKMLGLKQVKEAISHETDNTIGADSKAGETRNFLETKKHHTGIVIQDNQPAGYVTLEILQQKNENLSVRELMRPFPVMLELQTTLRDSLSYMLMHDVPLLCATNENGCFAGTVTHRDIQRVILKLYSETEETQQ